MYKKLTLDSERNIPYSKFPTLNGSPPKYTSLQLPNFFEDPCEHDGPEKRITCFPFPPKMRSLPSTSVGKPPKKALKVSGGISGQTEHKVTAPPQFTEEQLRMRQALQEHQRQVTEIGRSLIRNFDRLNLIIQQNTPHRDER